MERGASEQRGRILNDWNFCQMEVNSLIPDARYSQSSSVFRFSGSQRGKGRGGKRREEGKGGEGREEEGKGDGRGEEGTTFAKYFVVVAVGNLDFVNIS